MPTVVEHRERGASTGAVAGAVDGAARLLRHVRASARRRAAGAQAAAKPQGLVPGFGGYLRTTIANAVHSGNGRTAADDDDTDIIRCRSPKMRCAQAPSTQILYGHVLVLVKRLPQTGDGAGVFLAVDGQPDGTVARKRYWRGNFLFAQDPALGSPGFKRFRPIVREKNGTLRRLTNNEIAKIRDYGDYSLDQSKLAVEDFYDRMDDVMSPAPLEPMRALKEAITALEEQLNARVASVENGRKHLVEGGREVAMPGRRVDLRDHRRVGRLRHAVSRSALVDRGRRGARVPGSPRGGRSVTPAGKSAAEVKAELDATLASELSTREFSYTRTDGSQWTLKLKMLDRMPALEMAYNVNDCAELRWGAPDNSEEAATCKRRASAAQRAKMAGEYRAWFSERRRPPRG